MYYVTKNGTLCIQVRETKLTREVIHRPSGDEVLLGTDYDYVHVQIQPPIPQRFEWVHKDNLTALKDAYK